MQTIRSNKKVVSSITRTKLCAKQTYLISNFETDKSYITYTTMPSRQTWSRIIWYDRRFCIAWPCKQVSTSYTSNKLNSTKFHIELHPNRCGLRNYNQTMSHFPMFFFSEQKRKWCSLTIKGMLWLKSALCPNRQMCHHFGA